MKKNILFLLMLVIIKSANAYKGMYVDNFASILGAAPAENDLINYCVANNIDHITLFGLCYDGGPNHPGVAILDTPYSSTLHAQLASFITSAHNNSIKVNAIVQLDWANLHAEMRRVNEYNALNPSAKIDGVSIESEFWNDPVGLAFASNAGQFMTDLRNNPTAHNPFGLDIEIYVSRATPTEYGTMVTKADRILLATYIIDQDPDNYFAYKEGELDDIQTAATTNSLSSPFEVIILYNAMPAYNTHWIYQNAGWNANATPDFTGYDMVHSEFTTDYSSAVTANPSRFTLINLNGSKWFTYSYILHLMNFEENDHLLNLYKSFDGTDDYMTVQAPSVGSSSTDLMNLAIDRDFTLSFGGYLKTNSREQVVFSMYIRDKLTHTKQAGWEIGRDASNHWYFEKYVPGTGAIRTTHTGSYSTNTGISLRNSGNTDYINFWGTIYSYSYTRTNPTYSTSLYDYHIIIGDDDEFMYSSTTTAMHADVDFIRIWDRMIDASENPGCEGIISPEMEGLIAQWDMGSPELFPQDFFYSQVVYDNTLNGNHASMGSTTDYDANDPYYLALTTYGSCWRKADFTRSFDGNQDILTLPPTDFTRLPVCTTTQLYNSFKMEFTACHGQDIKDINDQRDAAYDLAGTAQNQRVYYTPYLFHNSGGTPAEGVEIYYNRDGDLEFKVYDNNGNPNIATFPITYIPFSSPAIKYNGVFSCEIQQTSSSSFDLIISMFPFASGSPGSTTYAFTGVTPAFVNWLKGTGHNWTVGGHPAHSTDPLYMYTGTLNEIRMWNVTEDDMQNLTCNGVYDALGYVGINPLFRNATRLDYPPQSLIGNWRLDDYLGAQKVKNFSYLDSSLDGWAGPTLGFDPGEEPKAEEGCSYMYEGHGTVPLRKSYINPFEPFMSKFDSLKHLQSQTALNTSKPIQKSTTAVNTISVSPNPFDKNVTMSLTLQSFGKTPCTVEVFDLMGRSITRFTMMNNEQKTINTAEWPGGIYFVHVMAQNKIVQTPVKLVKQ